MPKVCPVCDTVYADTNAFCPVDGTTLHVVDLEGGLIGSVVADRYLVTDLLGEGGMGKVYLARHVRLPQQAAIKVLRPDMVRDPAAVARFNREASNASRIDDENVARVYDFGEAAGGTVYLAMEYVAGVSLRDLITREGALEPRRAAGIVDQIGRGLDAAHRLKIIHRDLKPDNILVIEGPDARDRVKVVDFGIAKAFGADEGNLTKTGFVVGTPEFMSPEQLMGMPLDARSDVYALALVAYQCLTAALPFPGDTPEQAMTGRLTRPPRRLEEVSGKNWPPALQAAFDAALSREVEGRPASAGAFARMVTTAIDGWIPSAVSLAPAPVKSPVSPRGAEGKGSTVKIAELSAPTRPTANRVPVIVAVVLVLALGGFFAARSLMSRAKEADVAGTNVPQATPTPSATPPASAASNPASGATSTSNLPPTAQMSPAAIAAAVRDSVTREMTARAKRDSAKLVALGKKGVETKGGASAPATTSAAAEAPRVVAPPTPPVTAADPSQRDSLSVLAGALRPGIDRVTAGRIADALRKLAPKITDPTLRATAYFRLIDASAKSGGDMDDMCASYRAAKSAARGDAQLAELRKFEQRLGGCS